MATADDRTRSGLVWMAAAIALAVVAGYVGYIASGAHEPIIGALIWTGRLAFLIFLVPLFARPARVLFKSPATAMLTRWRRTAGICYGAVQSVHLVIVITMFVVMPNPPTETIMVLVGALGLALSLAMLVTSFPAPTRAIGPKAWRLVHRAGFHVFMFIYVFDFVIEPMLLGQPYSHLLWAALTLLGMVLRSLVLVQRKPQPAAVR